MTQESNSNPRYRRYISRINQLIERGKAFTGPENFEVHSFTGSYVFQDERQSASYSGWTVNCEHLLASVFGTESLVLERFRTASKVCSRSKVRRQVQILSAALEDLEGGFLLGQELLVAGVVFDDILDEASTLQRAGHSRAAAVLARTVLEGALRRLARAIDIEHTGALNGVNDRLKEEGVYHQSRWRRNQSLLDIGNAAAHPGDDWEKYSHGDVASMIDQIESFLATDFHA